MLPARCVDCGKGGTYLSASCVKKMVVPYPHIIATTEYAFDRATAAAVLKAAGAQEVNFYTFARDIWNLLVAWTVPPINSK